MKKFSFLLLLVVLTLILYTGLIFAQGDQGQTLIDLKGGNIEFDLNLLNYYSLTDKGDGLITDGDLEFFNFVNGHHNLWIGLEGLILQNKFNWSLDLVRDPRNMLDTDLNDGVNLSLLKEIEDGEIELFSRIDMNANQLWTSLTDDLTLRVNKSIGNIEGQAQVRVNNNLTPIMNNETYISYTPFNDFTLTAKPYALPINLGNVFGYNYAPGPGLRVEYSMDDSEITSGLNTTGNKSFFDVDDSNDFNFSLRPATRIEGSGRSSTKTRAINHLGNYENERENDNSFVSLGYLVWLNRVSNNAKIDGYVFGDENIDAEHKAVQKATNYLLALNLMGQEQLTDELIINAETHFDFRRMGGGTLIRETEIDDNDDATDEESITRDDLETLINLGLFVQLENQTDIADIYTSYTFNLEREVSDESFDQVEESYDDRITETTFMNSLLLGTRKPLENNLNLNTELTLGLETGNIKEDLGVPDTINVIDKDSEFTAELTAKLQYTF